MPCLLEANLDPPDPRKEPDDVEAGRLSLSGHERKSSRWTGGETNICSFLGQEMGQGAPRIPADLHVARSREIRLKSSST
jgi:hypothetical protein